MLRVPCLLCGDQNATISILEDSFYCGTCNGTIPVEQAKEVTLAWIAFLDWLSKAPSPPFILGLAVKVIKDS